MKLLSLLFAVAAVLFVPTLALATAIPDPGADLQGFLDLLASLWASAAWAPLIALLVVGVTWALRTYAAASIPWLASRRGVLTLAALSALGLSVAQQLLAGEASIPAIIVQAVIAVAGAVGVHAGITSGAKGGTSERLAD